MAVRAAVIVSAHGQDAWIFRRRRRPSMHQPGGGARDGPSDLSMAREFAGKLPTFFLFAMDHPKVVYDDDARPLWRLFRDRQGDR